MKRPLILVALLYLAGIFLAGSITLSPTVLLAVSLSLALATLVWAQARPWLLCALILLTGWTNTALRTAIMSSQDVRRILGKPAALVTFRGILTETPSLRVFVQDGQESWRTLAVQAEGSQIDLRKRAP